MPPLSRREAIVLTIATLGAACSPRPPDPSPKPTALKPPEPTPSLSIPKDEAKIIQTAKRIAAQYFHPDLPIAKIYLGGRIQDLSFFDLPIPLGQIEQPNVNSAFIFGDGTVSADLGFSVLRNGSRIGAFSVVDKQPATIRFSTNWLNCPDQKVQALAMEKEALYVSLWPGFRDFLTSFNAQRFGYSLVPLRGQQVSKEQMEDSIADISLAQTPQLTKLFQYMPYLALLSSVDRLTAGSLDLNALISQLELFNFHTIHQMAQAAGVNYTALSAGTPAFYNEALLPGSRWGTMIVRSSLPGPIQVEQPPVNTPIPKPQTPNSTPQKPVRA